MNDILLIDDNSYVLETLALRIGMFLEDVNILTAGNGREAIEIMDAQPVAFILTDLQMPVLDGFGVIEHRNRHFPHIPLFAMSAAFTGEARERLTALGITEHIEKPFDFEPLARKIVRALHAGSNVYAMLAGGATGKLSAHPV